MSSHPWLSGLVGGVTIGGAACILLVLLGRIAGVSGILGGALRPEVSDRAWRVAFLLGIPLGAMLFGALRGESLRVEMVASPVLLVLAGLLVGFGTQESNGCTSGHGVCGLARRSRRSFVATLTFMTAGMATVWLERWLSGSSR